MVDAEACRNRATDFKRRAMSELDKETRLAFLEVADAWLELAEKAVELRRLRYRVDPAE
jgi:hypothetical protein